MGRRRRRLARHKRLSPPAPLSVQGSRVCPDGSLPEIGAGAARGRGRDVPPSPSPRFPFPAVPVHACGSLIPSEIGEIFGAVCRPRAPSSPTPAKQFPINRSLLKEPKYYFYDVGNARDDPGARLENLVATALLRELHLIEDTTGRRATLHYLRDREKREVDFLAVIDGSPALMVEVKAGDDNFEKSLLHFRRFLPGVRTVQLVFGLRKAKSSEGVEMISAYEFLSKPGSYIFSD